MLWAARTIEAAEPAIRAEYERGRSDFLREQLDAVSARRKERDERLGLHSEREQDAEPVAHICILPTHAGPRKYFTKPNDKRGFPVYASPPKRKPLPRERVDAIFNAHQDAPLMKFRYLVTRAVERAHGIGDE